MSGFRGTIGSSEKDEVAAWIYDHIERNQLGDRERKAIFKFVQDMGFDRNHLRQIENKSFRERTAKLVRKEYLQRIDANQTWHPDLKARLCNLVTRHYRQAIGAGMSAPACWWCKERIRIQQPFKVRDDHKMHYRCTREYDEQALSDKSLS